MFNNETIYDEYDSILSEHGYVKNPKAVIDGLQYRIKETPSPSITRTYLATVANSCSYADDQMNLVDSSDDATYKLVGSGYTDENSEDYVFSYVKGPTDWVGCYVGTLSSLKFKVSKKRQTGSISVNHQTEEKPLDVQMAENALIDEPWLESLSNGDKLIKSYRYAIESRILHNLNAQKPQGYVLSKDKSKLLYCSGIPGKHSDYIYITANIEKYIDKETTEVKQRLTNRHITQGQAELLAEGFEYNAINKFPTPVSFIDNDPSVLFFNSNIDVYSAHSFAHTIVERADRLPNDLKISEKKLADSIISSIQKSELMQKADFNFIRPMYYPKYDKICYLLPLYISGALGEKPDLALVISRGIQFASLRTIIGLGEAYADARVLGHPENAWLKRNWCFQEAEK